MQLHSCKSRHIIQLASQLCTIQLHMQLSIALATYSVIIYLNIIHVAIASQAGYSSIYLPLLYMNSVSMCSCMHVCYYSYNYNNKLDSQLHFSILLSISAMNTRTEGSGTFNVFCTTSLSFCYNQSVTQTHKGKPHASALWLHWCYHKPWPVNITNAYS